MANQLQQGQVLLIIVLIMVVALTVGLSVASRSITNLRITTDDDNSQRAFSAAEAGVERLIKSSCTGVCALGKTDLDNQSSFEGKVTAIKGESFLIRGGVPVRKNEGADVMLSDYSADPEKLYDNQWNGTLTIYWGDGNGDCNNAALQFMVLHGSKLSPVLTQYAYDPCDDRADENSFTKLTPSEKVATPLGSKIFKYHRDIVIDESSKGLLMRVIPLYTNSTIGIKKVVGNDLPIQGQEIEAEGTSNGTVRKVTFVQSYSSIPSEFFQYLTVQ